jgi:hypothetical protein
MIRTTLTRSLAALVLLAATTACNKEKDTTATIRVVDEDGRPVPDAYVKLWANLAYQPPGSGSIDRLKREGLTGSDGTVEFDYTQQYKQGQAGFAVLDITSFKDSMVGEGIIKILEEEENEETVTLKFAY